MSDLVQPILVHKNSGSHLDVVVAVAQASVGAWMASKHIPECAERWDKWLSGPFTKTVRRADQKTLEALFWEAETVVSGEDGPEGAAIAMAFLPMSPQEFPKEIKRAQVSGLNRPRIHLPFLKNPHITYPRVVVDEALEMSTGKTAAQVAHGVFAWALRRPEWIHEWWIEGMPIDVYETDRFDCVAKRSDLIVRINDAGRTEVEPGSLTVVVY